MKANYKSCENSDTVSVEILKILGNTIEEPDLGKIFPNPSSDLFTMELEIKESGKYTAVISDNQGHIILELREEYLPKGRKTLQVNMEKYSVGIYFWLIKGQDLQIVKKIIKK